MDSPARFRLFQPLLVGQDGRFAPRPAVASYRAGLRALFNLNPLPVIIRGLEKDEPTRLGIVRAKSMLRNGFAKARAGHAGR